MPRQNKNFRLLIAPAQHWNSLNRRGTYASQVEAAVLAPSKKAAAEAFGVSLHEFNTYGGETWNLETLEALAQHPPGTLLVKGLDPGNTVMGQEGWVVATLKKPKNG